jgi:hypothetical protein
MNCGRPKSGGVGWRRQVLAARRPGDAQEQLGDNISYALGGELSVTLRIKPYNCANFGQIAKWFEPLGRCPGSGVHGQVERFKARPICPKPVFDGWRPLLSSFRFALAPFFCLIPTLKAAMSKAFPRDLIDIALAFGGCARPEHSLATPVTMTQTPMKPDLDAVFVRLRELLVAHREGLTVDDDTSTKYSLHAPVGPATIKAWGGKAKTPTIPVAWVQVGKAYVSYHLMGVYGAPRLMENCSKQLKARMQGKSCFNVNTIDEELFSELSRLTGESLGAMKKAGFVSS